MATLYASGADWNTASHWGTTSGASDGSVPTSSDDVIFDANSVNMSLSAAANAKSIVSTNYTGTLDLISYDLTIGTGTWGVGGSSTVKLNGTQTINKNPTFATGATCVYSATSGTVTMKNWTYKNLTIDGSGGTFKFGEAHTGITTFTITAGTFDHANGDYAITCSTSLTVNGGTFSGGSANLTAGIFTLSSGSFTSTSGTFEVTTGNATAWNKTGGTFTHNSGTVKLSAASQTAVPAADAYYNVILEPVAASTITITGTWDINGTLTTAEIGSLLGGTINASGDCNIGHGASNSEDTTAINFDGSGQTITGSGNGSIGPFTISSTGGTITFTGTFALGGTSATWASGTVDMSGSTFTLKGGTASKTIDMASVVWGNVIWNHGGASGETVTITGTMYIGGDWTYTQGNTINGAMDIKGSISVTDDVGGNCAITWSGSASKTMTLSTATYLPSGTFTVNGSGTLTLGSDVNLNTTGQDLVYTAGTLDLAGYNVTVNDTFSIASGATLKMKGSETITAGTKTYNSGMTVEYYDAAVTAVVGNFGTSLPNMKFFGGKTHNFTASGNFSSAGTWQVSGGTGKALLRSTVDGTKWNLNFTGTSNLSSNVDVKNSDASSGNQVSAIGSTNSGGNTNWDFGTLHHLYEQAETIVFAGD